MKYPQQQIGSSVLAVAICKCAQFYEGALQGRIIVVNTFDGSGQLELFPFIAIVEEVWMSEYGEKRTGDVQYENRCGLLVDVHEKNGCELGGTRRFLTEIHLCSPVYTSGAGFGKLPGFRFDLYSNDHYGHREVRFSEYLLSVPELMRLIEEALVRFSYKGISNWFSRLHGECHAG